MKIKGQTKCQRPENADAYPVLKKNDNSTVYYGYEKCARIYTNQKDTKAVHSFTYMAKDDTIPSLTLVRL